MANEDIAPLASRQGSLHAQKVLFHSSPKEEKKTGALIGQSHGRTQNGDSVRLLLAGCSHARSDKYTPLCSRCPLLDPSTPFLLSLSLSHSLSLSPHLHTPLSLPIHHAGQQPSSTSVLRQQRRKTSPELSSEPHLCLHCLVLLCQLSRLLLLQQQPHSIQLLRTRLQILFFLNSTTSLWSEHHHCCLRQEYLHPLFVLCQGPSLPRVLQTRLAR